MNKYKYDKIITKLFLQKEYIKCKRLPKDIAKQVKCSLTTIRRYLKLYKIYIRTLSEVKMGHKISEIVRKKISKTRIEKGIAKGKNNPNYGGKFYGIPKINLSGKENPNYKDGRTPLISRIYGSDKYKEWRILVYMKDNYTCQECGQYGGDLEAHHIKLFVKIFLEFLQKYSQFSLTKNKEILLKLALQYKPFWDITNGKTLHKNCHLKQHPKKRNKNGTFKEAVLV